MILDEAMHAITSRAALGLETARRRWSQAVPAEWGPIETWTARFGQAGRLTVNFHPDRVGRAGLSVAAGLMADGRYRSQWATGLSSGSRSAIRGGERDRFERNLFGGVYDTADPSTTEFPVYGSLDLLVDPHGGSPRFGSSYIVLKSHVRDRTTLCIGDSHLGPPDVGTNAAPECLLAALAEQATAGRLLDRPFGLGVLHATIVGQHTEVGPGRYLDGYIEAQIHGGVQLADDVAAMVVDPSFQGTDVERDLTVAATRYGFDLRWHGGSLLSVDDIPTDFRGPSMPSLARRVARSDGLIDAVSIGRDARRHPVTPPSLDGDAPESELQQLKYLWHTLLAFGRDAMR